MSQPPDDPGPPGSPPQGDEPPRRVDDTRPLTSTPPEGDSPPPEGRVPPATVLQEAGRERQRTADPSWMTAETDRMRALPETFEPRAWRVVLQTLQPGSARIGLNVRQPLVMGRADPHGDRNPDLDLTPHMAAEQGVSRRHAALVPAYEALYLVDLGSTNGTWVNGVFVEENRRHPVRSGDRIELGLLRLIVRSVTAVERPAAGGGGEKS